MRFVLHTHTLSCSVLKGESNIVASTSERHLLMDEKSALVSQAGWAPFNEAGGQVRALIALFCSLRRVEICNSNK